MSYTQLNQRTHMYLTDAVEHAIGSNWYLNKYGVMGRNAEHLYSFDTDFGIHPEDPAPTPPDYPIYWGSSFYDVCEMLAICPTVAAAFERVDPSPTTRRPAHYIQIKEVYFVLQNSNRVTVDVLKAAATWAEIGFNNTAIFATLSLKTARARAQHEEDIWRSNPTSDTFGYFVQADDYDLYYGEIADEEEEEEDEWDDDDEDKLEEDKVQEDEIEEDEVEEDGD
ncbi:hypothetical protein C8R46DRAFT_1355871 [Mycena filopes]|nr:hypothetical protein C8R46DRAFT_1355871 [Mycena filopes]